MNLEIEKLERGGEIVVPLYAEEVSVAKRQIVTGRARISTVTRRREERVEEALTREVVEIERRQVGEPVDRMPSVRQEGDTIVIPVVEERLVVERRLVLKEEVRVRRLRKTEIHQESVMTRSQDVTIARLPGQET
jgi:uncharacterized protein (TIGR02271 family)